MMTRLHLCLIVLAGAIAFGVFSSSAQEKNSPDSAAAAGMSLDSLLNVKINAAAKYEQTAGEAPASVTIITSDDIDHYGYRTLSDVLNSVRGFYTSYDRNYAYVGVRGFGRPTDYDDRNLLLLDGHTINENVFGSASIGTELGIDLKGLERIEIVRGPGSALYGAGAMFSVINLITKKGKTIDGIQLYEEAGSYGNYSGSMLFGKELNENLDVSCSAQWGDVGGHDLHYAEYDTVANNGTAVNLDWDRYYGVMTNIRYKKFSFLGNITSREKGIPTGAFGMVFNDSRARTLDEYKQVQLKYENDLDPGMHVMARGYFDHYNYDGTYPYDTLSFDAATGNWFGAEGQFRWDVRSDNRLTIGSEFKKDSRAEYKVWDEFSEYFDRNVSSDLTSLYAQDDYQLAENLMVTIGVRSDVYSEGEQATTPRAGLVFHPNNTGTLKLLYGEAFRLPNLYEADYEDPYAHYKINPDLQPEKIKTTELDWEQRLAGSLLGELSLYHYDMRDLIDQTLDTTDNYTIFRNVSRVGANGIEAEVTAHYESGFSGYASYTYQATRDLDLDRQLTNSPQHLIKFGVTYPLWKKVTAAFDGYYESGRRTLPPSGTMTSPYFLAHLNISVRPWGERLQCSLLVRNLFDVSYATPGGVEHLQAAIEQDGRTAFFRLGFRF